MDDERRRWVETLVTACTRVLKDRERLVGDDARVEEVRAAVHDLRDRLLNELARNTPARG